MSIAGTALGIGSIAKQCLDKAKGRQFARQLAAMGSLVGQPKSTSIQMLGKPTSTVLKGEGKVALVWGWPGYAIALLFKGDECQRVLYEKFLRPLMAWRRCRSCGRLSANAVGPEVLDRGRWRTLFQASKLEDI